MKNVFLIGLIVVAMGYMVSIMFDRYDAAIEQEKKQKVMPQK